MPELISRVTVRCARLVLVFGLIWSAHGGFARADEQAPHIVFILADDMGYGDVHALNPASTIPTPHLDGLAAAGMTFTDAHTPSSVCTPTRYGLMTGRYCWRTRLTKGVLDGYGEPLIEPDRMTVADLLRTRGYHTGIVGKWHLGLGFAKQGRTFDFTQPVSDGPHTHGFDESFIIPASLDFPPYVFIRNGEITGHPLEDQPAQSFPRFLRKGERGSNLNMPEVLDVLASEAGDFIRRSAAGDQPFFLYVPLTGPHKPVWPHPRYEGRTRLGPYGDFIVNVDDTVGKILRAIEAAGVQQNTLVIYSSDNGSFMFRRDEPEFVDHVADSSVQAYRASHHTSNGPLRGTKADIWEAGHRVPFLARWPQRIQAGSTCAETICLTDFFATAAEITSAESPADQGPDSFSVLPLLRGKTWESPRPPVIHHSADGMFAIREGDWKLVLGNGSGGREAPRGTPFERPYQLFDLSVDIGEQRNVIDKHTEVANRLEQACESVRGRGSSR